MEYKHFPTLSVVSAKQEDLLTANTWTFFMLILWSIFKIFYMNIQSWVSDSFENADTGESSNLEDELVELTTNEEFKVKI